MRTMALTTALVLMAGTAAGQEERRDPVQYLLIGGGFVRAEDAQSRVGYSASAEWVWEYACERRDLGEWWNEATHGDLFYFEVHFYGEVNALGVRGGSTGGD